MLKHFDSSQDAMRWLQDVSSAYPVYFIASPAGCPAMLCESCTRKAYEDFADDADIEAAGSCSDLEGFERCDSCNVLLDNYHTEQDYERFMQSAYADSWDVHGFILAS